MTADDAKTQLRIWRVRNKMRQGPMAERLGVSQSHLSSIESGATVPGLEVAARIEDMTGIPAREWATPASESETVEQEASR